MTLVTYALTTRQKVKDYLGITDTSKDTLIDQLINAATVAIESYCGGRRFLSASYSEVRDGGKETYILNQYPATAISSVKYNTGTPSTPVWSTYNADDYYKYLPEAKVKFPGKTACIPQYLQFNYTAGYLIDFANETTTSHTLPLDLTQVCTELAAKGANTSTSEGISSQTTEGQTVQFDIGKSNKWSDAQKNILNKYKAYRYGV